MRWQDQLNGDSLSWLLERESPGVRYLALRDLLDAASDDRELKRARRAAHQLGPIAGILAAMEPPGYWVRPGPGYNPKYRSASWSLILLAQLGGSVEEDPRIAAACTYALEHALLPGGQFTSTGAASGTIDCLQGNLCWALTELGCRHDRLESAFEWMARSVTGEGIASAEETDARSRYYAYKCGPLFACGVNGKRPCAWGGVKVMLAFANWPHRHSPIFARAVKQGAEFLLNRDPAKADYPSRLGGKPSRSWFQFSFPVFYVTDVLQNVEALSALGHGRDPRLADALQFIREKQDAEGRWSLEYDYAGKTWMDAGEKKQANKWVTLRALRTLKRACA